MTQDYAEAKRWYEKGAAAGNSGAMSSLGYIYELGEGVTKDYVEAKRWFEKQQLQTSRLRCLAWESSTATDTA